MATPETESLVNRIRASRIPVRMVQRVVTAVPHSHANEFEHKQVAVPIEYSMPCLALN